MQDLPKTSLAIEAGIGKTHQGAQLYIARNGAEQHFTWGNLTPDHQMLWMSSVKPITAVAISQLWEQRKLQLDDSVATHIPDFAANGKADITIRHLLTHTGGFRAPHASWKPQELTGIIDRICAAKLEPGWIPGQKAGYHPDTSWYILGELVHRVSGVPLQNYLRAHIFAPLGMHNSHLGIPEDQQGQRVASVYEPDGEGLKLRAALNDPRVVALVRPGGNGRGPARELGRFYRALLAGGEGIISPQTVAALTARHRVGMYDHTFRHEMDWGLGFIIDSKRHGLETVPYGYGDHCSTNTFGHSGSQSSAAFADPEAGLVVVLIFDGMPGETAHQSRMRSCLNAIYADLGLVRD